MKKYMMPAFRLKIFPFLLVLSSFGYTNCGIYKPKNFDIKSFLGYADCKP